MGCGSVDNLNHNNMIPNSIKKNIPEIIELYTDKIFPPENISIFEKKILEDIDNGNKIPDSKYYKILFKDFKENQIIWKRARDIFKNGEYTLFSDNMSPNNMIQGSIGNCYFLTVLSALTKYPSLIYQLFNNTLNIIQNGYYEINLKIDNEITTITLDDYFPYNIRKNKPVFCKPYKNEIWVMLLEKAWAKTRGSYFNMDKGSPLIVLNTFLFSMKFKEDITYHFYSLNNSNYKDKIWNMMINKIKYKKNIFMICLSKENLNDKKRINNLKYSIVERHFYNIIEIYENEGKNRLKLRNPWGFNSQNKNKRNNKNEFDFFINENEDIDNIKQDKDDLLSLEEGEFIIDYNYFCYLFEEIQIYEIKKFSFNINCYLKKRCDCINILYLKFKETKFKENIKVKIYLGDKNISNENEHINFTLLIIEKQKMNLSKKLTHKIYLNNPILEFTITMESNTFNKFYLILEFSSNTNKLNNLKINVVFKNDNYIDIINYRQYFDDKRLLEIIKKEFGDSIINNDYFKYKEDIFS